MSLAEVPGHPRRQRHGRTRLALPLGILAGLLVGALAFVMASGGPAGIGWAAVAAGVLGFVALGLGVALGAVLDAQQPRSHARRVRRRATLAAIGEEGLPPAPEQHFGSHPNIH